MDAANREAFQQLPDIGHSDSESVHSDHSDAHHIREKLKLFKFKNRALQDANDHLVSRVLELEEVVLRYESTLDLVTSLRKPFRHFPPEILHMIFQRTIPPSFLLDCSTSSGPDSLWCRVMRQKQSLVAVCRTWYRVGVGFLYEDICIRQIYQFPQLLQTFVDNSANLQAMVKTFAFYCLIPATFYRQFQDHIKYLFEICPNLARFAYTSPCELPHPDLIPPLSPSIIHLHLSDSIPNETITQLLGDCAPQLVTLSLYLRPATTSLKIKGSFERLEELTWELTSRTINSITTIAEHWELPALHRLTFKLRGNPTNWVSVIPSAPLELFCKRHGANLKFLHFHPEYWWSMYTYFVDVRGILLACPALEHLVLHPRTSQSLAHPNIKWIDIWSSHVLASCVDEWQVMRSQLTKHNFPSLKGVRTISSSLAYLYQLPAMLPPNSVTSSGDDFSFKFLDFEVRHEMGAVVSVLPEWPGDGEEDDEDGTFQTLSTEESDVETGSSWSAVGSEAGIRSTWEAKVDLLADSSDEGGDIDLDES